MFIGASSWHPPLSVISVAQRREKQAPEPERELDSRSVNFIYRLQAPQPPQPSGDSLATLGAANRSAAAGAAPRACVTKPGHSLTPPCLLLLRASGRHLLY